MIATAVGACVGTAVYVLTLLDFSTQLGRTANALGYASGFFDIQGRAFLDGSLDVPRGSLGIEGFIQDGREYMYFGPWPALLRLPLLATTTEFDGQLTVFSMALAFALLVVIVCRLVWLVRDMMYPGRLVSRLEAASVAVLIALATGGTTVTYISALPWVYHEVYAWAVAVALGAIYWLLRVMRNPTRNAIAWLVVFDLAMIMTRTTGGWAVCLATVGVGVWMLLRSRSGERTGRRVAWTVVGGGALALLAGITFNWVKFQHPFLFPLEDQVWTEVNAHRREALEVNGGTITGPQFFPTALMAYFRLDGIRFVDHFPFITLPAEPAQAYAGAFVDQSYRTGSVTAFMPWLLVLTVIAAIVIFRPGVDLARRQLRVALATGVLITGGVMAYGYFAHRYTAEFVPALVVGGAIGGTALTHWIQQRRPVLGRAVLVVAAGLTAFSVLATMAVAQTATALTAGGDRLGDYLALQNRLTPGAQADLVTISDDLPSGGSADDLWIRGDCDALYVNSGDTYDRWHLVERRSLVVVASLDRRTSPGRVELISTTTSEPRSVWLQVAANGEARVQIVEESGTRSGPWFEVLQPRRIRIGVRDQGDLGYAEVSSNPGGFVGMVRTFEWGEEWIASPTDVVVSEPDPDRLESIGVALRTERGLTPPVCDQIRRSAAAHGVR